MRFRWLLLLCVLFLPEGSQAGPNAGGVLILHTDASIVYTTGATYCSVGLPASCQAAVSTIPAGQTTPVVFHVLAAFPPLAQPRLKATAFGVSYDAAAFVLVDHGSCAGLEISQPLWPAPGTGTGLYWDSAQTNTIADLYWFAGYPYAPDVPTAFLVQEHPQQERTFVDDSVPPGSDLITEFGILGFGQDGYVPCPGAATPAGTIKGVRD